MEIKHSILLISYNQDKFIGKAIDSIVEQTEQPYELVISDDCSTDNSWAVIEQYREKYPHLIKTHRNDPNLGIYGNIAKIKSLASGNVLSFLACDDYYFPETVERMSRAIKENNLDPENDKFFLIFNNVLLYQNTGVEFLWDNYRCREKKAFKEQLRSGLSTRNIGISKTLSTSLTPMEVLKEKLTVKYLDWAINLEEALICDKFVYINYPSEVYRVGVGITTNINTTEFTDNKLFIKYIKDTWSDSLEKDDLIFLDFLDKVSNYKINPTLRTYFVALFSYFQNYNNFSFNNPWFRNVHYFIPNSIVQKIKRTIYPFIISLRSKAQKI